MNSVKLEIVTPSKLFYRGEVDLVIVTTLEGDEGFKHLEEYADRTTERGRAMRQAICDRFHFSSLEFQSLEGLEEAIGIDRCKLCTYCWNGKE